MRSRPQEGQNFDLPVISLPQREQNMRGSYRPAPQVLHDEVDDPSRAADPIDRDDVGMLQLRRGPGLTLEALDELRVEGQGERQDLDRHLALEVAVAGPVDHRHSAPPQLLDDLVLGRQSLAHEIGLLHGSGGDRVHRSRGHEIETAGGTEF